MMSYEKHIYLCHNLMTLYKSFSFSQINGHENIASYIYLDFNAKIPEELMVAFSEITSITIVTYLFDKTEKIPFIHWKKYVKDVLEATDKKINNDPVILHVYLDMWAFMPSLIEKVKKKYGSKSRVYMHEEGYAMYAKRNNQHVSHYYIKKILYALCGLSSYGLTTYAHGNHPAVERIYCAYPDKAREAGKREQVGIYYEGELFQKTNTDEFLRMCKVDSLTVSGLFSEYNYVFLSQPVYDVIGEKRYTSFLMELFRNLSGKKVLVKLHPRDTFNYSAYLGEHVNILAGILNALPFECIYPYVANARILTFNSSCCENIKPVKQSFYMYKLLRDEKYNSICERVEYNPEKVVVISSFAEVWN